MVVAILSSFLAVFRGLINKERTLLPKLAINLIWYLPPPGWAGPIYHYRGRDDIANPRSRFSFKSAEYLPARYTNRRATVEFHNREDWYAFFDLDFLVDKFIYGSTNQVITFKPPHFWVIVFICFCTFWFITALFAGYKDVWLGFMTIALCFAIALLFWSNWVQFLVSYFFSALLLLVVWWFLVPQLLYCYEWLICMTLLTVGAGLWSIDMLPWIIWGTVPLLWLIPLMIVPMSYIYTILMNDVYVPQFDIETESWEDEEVKGGQETEVKLIRLVLSEQSRIRRLRKYIENLRVMEEARIEEAEQEEAEQAKGLNIVYAGASDDAENPLPAVDEAEARRTIGKLTGVEIDAKAESEKGWQASIGEQKRVKFINKRIADFEKELLTAPTEEIRQAYVSKIEELKRKKIDDNIDSIRYEKADREHRMIHGTQEPSYTDLILHAQDTTTLNARIQNRVRSLEIAAESPLALGDGSGSGGGALEVLRVKDVKLFDNEEIEAAQQSDAYKQMQKSFEEIRRLGATPYKEFVGSPEEFNKVGDRGLSEETEPTAKLLAYGRGWDLFTPEEKEGMKSEGLWPPNTIKWNHVKKKYEKLK